MPVPIPQHPAEQAKVLEYARCLFNLLPGEMHCRVQPKTVMNQHCTPWSTSLNGMGLVIGTAIRKRTLMLLVADPSRPSNRKSWCAIAYTCVSGLNRAQVTALKDAAYGALKTP